MKQSCIIVEDEPLARDVLREYISMHGELTLTASYESADKACPHCNPFHLIFSSLT